MRFSVECLLARGLLSETMAGAADGVLAAKKGWMDEGSEEQGV